MKMEENISPVSYGDYEITRPPWLNKERYQDIKGFINEYKVKEPMDLFLYSWIQDLAKQAGYRINLSEAEDIVMKFFKDDSK